MQSYEQILARADHHFSQVIDEQPAALHCRLGCTFCCNGLFEITPADMVVMMKGLRALEHPARAELARRAGEIIERLDHPDLEDLPEPERRRFLIEVAGDEPCPALSAGGACTIYSHRPLICRTAGLPLRDGSAYRGGECELNFTSSSPGDKEKAAWDLQWEDAVGSQEHYTIPQAIMILARLIEQEDHAAEGHSNAEGAERGIS